MPVTQGLHRDLRRMIPPLSAYNDARVLAANTAESVTVPAGASFALFAGTADFYVRTGGTAAVPAADISDGTAPVLNPTARAVTAGDTLSLVSASSCIVTISWHLGQGEVSE